MAKSTGPRNMKAIIQQQLGAADRMLEQGQYNKVLEILSKLSIEDDQDRAKWLTLRSLALTRSGNPQQGLKLADDALRLLSTNQIKVLDEVHVATLLVEACLASIEAASRLKRWNDAMTMMRKVEDYLDIVSPSQRALLKAWIKYHHGTILWHQGALDEALVQIEDGILLLNQEKNGNPRSRQVLAYLLNRKGAIYIEKGELDRALEHLEQCLNLRKEIGNPHDVAVTLHNIAIIHTRKGNLDQALTYFEQSLANWKKIGNPHDIAKVLNKIGFVYREKGELNEALTYLEQSLEYWNEIDHLDGIAIALQSIGVIHADRGELDRALEYLEQSLTYWEKVDNPHGIASILNGIGNILAEKGDLNKALEKLEQSLEIRKKLNNPQDIAWTLNNLGITHREKGELDRALEYLEQSLVLCKEIGNPEAIAEVLLHLGVVFREKGEHERAISCLQESRKLRESIGNPMRVSETLFHLIVTLVEYNEFEQARYHLQQLENHATREQNALIHQRRDLCRALLLKSRPRARDKFEAQRIFEEIVNEEVVSHELTVFALLHYCELLVYELEMTGNEEVFIQARQALERLLVIAKQQHSHAIVAQSYWLLAKMALVEGNHDQARSLLLQAQVTAEEWGLERLAARISEDHDSMLIQLERKEWKETQTLSERARQLKLDDLVGQVARSQVLADFSDKLDETPVLLMIVSENGLPLHSKNFSSEIQGNPHLMSGFVSAVHTFSKEIFARTLDRLKVGEYTVVVFPESTLLIVYACKGASFRARQRLLQFMKRLKEHPKVLAQLKRKVETGLQTSESVLKVLESLIESSFQLEKSLP